MKASVDNRMEACEERDGPALSQAGTLYMIWKTSAIKVVVIHVHVCTLGYMNHKGRSKFYLGQMEERLTQ